MSDVKDTTVSRCPIYFDVERVAQISLIQGF